MAETHRDPAPRPERVRPRRLRASAALRALVAQTRVSAAQLVMPHFVLEKRAAREPIEPRHTHEEYRRLSAAGGWQFAPVRWLMKGPGRMSRGVRLGWQHGFDSGVMLDYIYQNQAQGITPLGGPREVGGHKGYGLAVMVHILGGTLAGASFSPLRNKTQKPSDPHNIGHFFMAIDPKAFRAGGEFEEDLDQVIDVLHGAKRVDPNQPVLVAGDPEMATRRERLGHGVPVPDDLITQLRAVATTAGVPFLLQDEQP